MFLQDVRQSLTLVMLVVAAILLVLVFHAPRLVDMVHHYPWVMQWFRADQFLEQCADPFRTSIEPAMKWRLLPPLIAHHLHLPGRTPLVIPWLGALAFFSFVGAQLRARGWDNRSAFMALVVVVSTSAGLVAMHWYGINDAWVWLGLAAVSFSRHSVFLAIACLLAPWVDERFIIGLPLAWMVRCIDQDKPFINRQLGWLAFLVPYFVIRLSAGGANPTVEREFVAVALSSLASYVGLAPLAWWMGLRAAWAPIAYAFVSIEGPRRYALATVFLLTAAVTITLAWDMSRSSAIVVPVAILGLLRFRHEHPILTPKVLIWVAAAALLMPSMHVVERRVVPVENIIIELKRVIF